MLLANNCRKLIKSTKNIEENEDTEGNEQGRNDELRTGSDEVLPSEESISTGGIGETESNGGSEADVDSDSENGAVSESASGEHVSNTPTLLDVIKTLYSKGKEVASKLFSMKFFDVAQTPKFMQELGLRGDKFTIKYGVISRHLGKDGSHTLTERDWEQLPQALQNPFAISKLTDKKDSYRIYTALRTESGEYVVVGVDVKNAGREIEVNAISTVFGRRNNANLPTNEDVIYRSKEITPEQSALLEQPNFAQYPNEQESSADKDTNLSEDNKGEAEKVSEGTNGEHIRKLPKAERAKAQRAALEELGIFAEVALPKGSKWSDGRKFGQKATRRSASTQITALVVGEDLYIKGIGLPWTNINNKNNDVYVIRNFRKWQSIGDFQMALLDHADIILTPAEDDAINTIFTENGIGFNRRITSPIEFQQSAEALENNTPSQQLATEAAVAMLENNGIEVVEATDEMVEVVLGQSEAEFMSKRSNERAEINKTIDNAISFVTGKPINEVRQERIRKERERKELAKEIYENALSGNFNDVILQKINQFIDDATPANPFGRRISQRIPHEMERGLLEGVRTNAIDALFSRISESSVGANERFSESGRREIESRKKEMLKAWAIATGNWYTDLSAFTDEAEPFAEGTDSKVYLSKDGQFVIKASKGKPYGKRFRPDIDNIVLFNNVFRNSRYEIVGYGEIDGQFVRILKQPIVDFSNSTPLTEDERVEYMRSLGFTPLNKEKSAFTNGKIIAADLQKNNIIRDNAGNVRVIDADMKLHTKDVGGDYEYLPVEYDLPSPQFHIVYHGTGTKFDAFDHSHMGEGEGAQAYGWGTYVTEVEGIGKDYAKVIRDKNASEKHRENAIINKLAKELLESKNGNKEDALAYLHELLNESWSDKKRVKAQIRIIERGKFLPETKAKAHLYTVEIPDDNGSNYLSWVDIIDGEIQERVANGLQNIGFEIEPNMNHLALSRNEKIAVLNINAKGKDLYAELSDALGSDKAASEFLNSIGFVGIKYPVQYTMGGRSDNAKNYVIFNENDAKIVDRVEFMRTPNGTVYGWTIGGKVYLTKSGMNPNTPVHEYTHLWSNAMMQKNPKGWQSIKDLLRGTPVWNEVMLDKNYANIHDNEDLVASEVLSRLSGKENAKKLEAMAEEMLKESKGIFAKAEAISLIERMKEALNKFWNWVGTNLFGIDKFDSIEQVTDRVLWDMATGTDLSGVEYSDIVEAQIDLTKEEQRIVSEAKANGTYMKAPNGQPTKLNEKQWVQVRTQAFKNWFGDWEMTFKKNFLLNGNPVATLTGEEFQRVPGKTLTEQVREYFESIGGKAVSPLFGEVILDKRGADDSLAHGMGRNKAIAYASVKEVIENGVLIDYDTDHKGRGYDSAVIAAPIEIGGNKFVCSVVVTRMDDNRFYLHEVTPIKNLQDAVFVTNLSQSSSAHLGDIAKVLQNIVIAKSDSSKVVDKNGEPLVVYHGSEAEFTIFDSSFNHKSNKGFFFTNSDAMARSYGNTKSFFLNIRDSYDIEGNGRNWNDLHVDILSHIPKLEDKIEMHRIMMRDAIERGVFSESSYEYWDKNFYQRLDFLKDESKNSVLDIIKKYVIRYQLKKFDSYFTLKTTRSIERIFQTFDADSNIIFRDITDYGSWVTDFAGANDVYVVTNPANIKSATDNNGEFDENNDDTLYRTAEEEEAVMDDFVLTKDNESDFSFALMQSIAGQSYSSRPDYNKLNGVEIRVKEHTPDWDNFVDWETDKANEKILNVTVGDYDNTDYRRNKREYEAFVNEHPETTAVDVKIEDGTSIADALKQIHEALQAKGIDFEFAPKYYWRKMYSEESNMLMREGTGAMNNAEELTGYMRDKVNELAERLGVNIEIVEDASTLKGKKSKAKGFFNPRTGTITVVLPNNSSIADVEQTVFHEAVAHYGLRQLFGDKFDKFLDEVYEFAEPEIRERIARMALRGGLDIRKATEEYLATLAEDTEYFENNPAQWKWFAKIKRAFIKMLRTVGLNYMVPRMSDNELRYFLWLSYENLRGKAMPIFKEAAQITKQQELGLDNYGQSVDKTDSVAEAEQTELELANERFNEELSDFKEKKHEGLLHLGKPMKILKAVGVNSKELTLSPSVLHQHLKKHSLTTDDLKNLAMAIQSPILVYRHGKTRPNIIVITELDVNNGKLSIAVKLDSNGNVVEVNNVSSVHSKDAITEISRLGMLNDIELKDNLRWVEKEKVSDWLGLPYEEERQVNPKLDTIAKVIQNFENPSISEEKNAEEGEVLYRKGETPREKYERVTRRPTINNDVKLYHNLWNRFVEAYQDKMQSLSALQKAVAEESGKQIKPHEDAYAAENRMSSENKAQAEIYKRDFFGPLMNVITNLIKNKKVTYEDIKDYLIAKHGLERNDHMAMRDAMQQALKDLGPEPERPTSYLDADYDAKQQAWEDWNVAYTEAVKTNYEANRQRDYSGLLELTESENVAEAEENCTKNGFITIICLYKFESCTNITS